MPSDLLGSLDKSNLSSQAAEKIREYIIANGLSTGDKLLTENQLMESLGVSRSTVREALRILKSSGVLESVRGHGTRIKRFDYDEAFQNLSLGFHVSTDRTSIRRLAEARYVVETSLVPLITANITDKDLKQLELCSERNAGAKSRPKQLEWDTKFHRQLMESSHNRYLFSMALVILEWFGTERSVVYLSKMAKEHGETIREHRRIVQACRDRNSKELQGALKAHLKVFRNFQMD